MLLKTKLLIEKTSDSSLEEIDTVIDLSSVVYIRQFIEDDDTPQAFRRESYVSFSSGEGFPIKVPFQDLFNLYKKSRNEESQTTEENLTDDTPSI